MTCAHRRAVERQTTHRAPLSRARTAHSSPALVPPLTSPFAQSQIMNGHRHAHARPGRCERKVMQVSLTKEGGDKWGFNFSAQAGSFVITSVNPGSPASSHPQLSPSSFPLALLSVNGTRTDGMGKADFAGLVRGAGTRWPNDGSPFVNRAQCSIVVQVGACGLTSETHGDAHYSRKFFVKLLVTRFMLELPSTLSRTRS